MARLFGTDGVRGVANRELTGELAFLLGKAGAMVLAAKKRRPRILIGRDTRISGDMLLHALAAGICAAGADAVDIGVMPTPGVAYVTRISDADAGVVISASHNSYEFNGIKWFDGSGFKLSDEVEDEIERIIRGDSKSELPTGEGIGGFSVDTTAADMYMDHLVEMCDADLFNMKIALDCANGAASAFAPEVFRRLGAVVLQMSAEPNGVNINADCGSTHPGRLCSFVKEHGAYAGLAFDGDADRLIAVDDMGEVVDGDRIMALCARDLNARGELKDSALVATVMSNLGMINTLKREGITVETTKVGDRYVLEKMLKEGRTLGGEQSGHLIFLDKNTTGDGIQSGIELLCAARRQGRPLSKLAHTIDIYPQLLINVRVPADKLELHDKDERIRDRIARTSECFGSTGRVLVRTSGTEPLVRVMVEGVDEADVLREAKEIAELIAERLGGTLKK